MHVDAANAPTTEESHDSFAPTRGRFWRLKLDQSTVRAPPAQRAHVPSAFP